MAVEEVFIFQESWSIFSLKSIPMWVWVQLMLCESILEAPGYIGMPHRGFRI